jgi:hypothetical protein
MRKWVAPVEAYTSSWSRLPWSRSSRLLRSRSCHSLSFSFKRDMYLSNADSRTVSDFSAGYSSVFSTREVPLQVLSEVVVLWHDTASFVV